MQNLETDILIVGTGLAGLSLAKYLSEQNPNLQITLLSKTSIDECNTYYAQGGIAVVHDFIKDSYQQHIQDTLLAGKGICVFRNQGGARMGNGIPCWTQHHHRMPVSAGTCAGNRNRALQRAEWLALRRLRHRTYPTGREHDCVIGSRSQERDQAEGIAGTQHNKKRGEPALLL